MKTTLKMTALAAISAFVLAGCSTHSMDAGQGYITNMELVKNNSKSGSVTSKTDLSTQNIVANDAKANAKSVL